ncbi:aromatic amino acid DMT transporter YddG [Photobacterium sp. DNB23_23_1]|uniref:Aromatic amino acid DMT transporter YddG n=1 Tax=Photobacterium pectinilyticum TaxID=2906793 RepID=A0ABT1MZR6_9GAMM|nr:aromatic amino acid DMT transporter YddG [Photobacterium sp. ZSDE20]MCQ1057996.1 aromatic amino acid DMT transporter YddG [Photobacterium sp. ZSDE20]MDD1822529.1 aromatic amino acid DMT transporter YddG [Photobacterium sp. ZSDE20]
MFSQHKYTLAGCVAILLWSTIVAFIRNVAEQLGPVGGAAMIYTLSSVLLVVVVGAPKLTRFSPRYLVIGGGLFVSYEMCLALALGMANDRVQTIEMSVINYLWPALTVMLAVVVSKQPVSKLLYPAMAMAFFGVAWTVSGDQGLSLTRLVENVATNPVSYTLAFSGAFIWAIYCNITKRLANGQNAISWFFIATAVALWVKYLLTDQPPMVWSSEALLNLVLAAVAMAGGYGLWNIAIIGGNMVLLATLSYFTPILSAFFSALIFGISLGMTFWQGVVMVTLASLSCWYLTRKKH